MTLYELSNLDNTTLTQLLLQYDQWTINDSKTHVIKSVVQHTINFSINDFSPFDNNQQADIILQHSGIDFSHIKTNDNITWGLCVFEDKNKKYLLLPSSSKHKSSLLLTLALKLGILESY